MSLPKLKPRYSLSNKAIKLLGSILEKSFILNIINLLAPFYLHLDLNKKYWVKLGKKNLIICDGLYFYPNLIVFHPPALSILSDIQCTKIKLNI